MADERKDVPSPDRTPQFNRDLPEAPPNVESTQEANRRRYVSQRAQPAAGIGCAVIFIVILVIWYLATQATGFLP